jgi:AcrR family transcriptional regulator
MVGNRANCELREATLMTVRNESQEVRAREPDRLGAAGSRGSKRRHGIFRALHDRVIAQGYAKTTLADIAQAAGISPSHLLYYFPGKDAILDQYFADMASRIMDRMRSFQAEPPERQIFLLAELFFGGKKVTKSEIGFMLELFGAAVHDKSLNREKAQLDAFCKAQLQELFKRLPCSTARATSLAEVAYALLLGLRTASFFDDRLSTEQARHLFYSEVMNLAERGREGPAGPPPRRRQSGVRVTG